MMPTIIPAQSIGSAAMICGLSFDQSPNKAPEPTPIARVSSAIAVRILNTAWLSFIR